MTDIYRNERTLSELVAGLTHESAVLFRHELRLARAEMADKASQMGAGAAEIAVGGVILLVSLQLLAAAAVIGLATVIGWWQSALVLGVVVLLVGTAVLLRGLAHLRAESLTPQRTLTSLRESGSWLRRRAAEGPAAIAGDRP